MTNHLTGAGPIPLGPAAIAQQERFAAEAAHRRGERCELGDECEVGNVIEEGNRRIAHAYGVPPEIVGIPVTHIAGLVLQIGTVVRQRCAWCGETLVDVDIREAGYEVVSTGGPGEQDGPGTWPVGGQVFVHHELSHVVDGQHLSADSCTTGG